MSLSPLCDHLPPYDRSRGSRWVAGVLEEFAGIEVRRGLEFRLVRHRPFSVHLGIGGFVGLLCLN